MKIRIREVGLLCVGFIIGIVVASLIINPSGPAAPPASHIVATGPVLAAAWVPPQSIAITNAESKTTSFEIILPPRFIDGIDSSSPLSPLNRSAVDLIDMRYQPDIKLDDLK